MTPNYEVQVKLWEGPVGQCCYPTIDVDEEGEPIYSQPVGAFRTVHVPRIGDLVPSGPGLWRVIAVQWSVVHERSMAWAAGDRGGWADVVVEPAKGIFWRPADDG